MSKKPRGFAAMSKEKHAEIAAMGGRKTHELGKRHVITQEEAAEYGRKGGIASGLSRKKKRKSVDLLDDEAVQ